MRLDDCYQLGYVVKTHGLKGDVTIQLDVDNPEEYQEMESVLLLQQSNLIPFFISDLSLSGTKAKVKFEDIDTLADANALKGSKLYLPLDVLPTLDQDEYYYHELVGFSLYEEEVHIGEITQIYQPSSQYLASVMHQEIEVLIPITDEIFTSIDKENKTIQVTLPEGLLELYLEDKSTDDED
ncbi:MAG: 16S rRNA processing protein RimM [Cyclobacteriaceae bacterium]